MMMMMVMMMIGLPIFFAIAKFSNSGLERNNRPKEQLQLVEVAILEER